MHRSGVFFLSKSLTLALLATTLLCLSAARAEPLRLDEVIAAVDRAFPLLRAAEQDRSAAEGELLAARGAFDPVLRARGSLLPLGYYLNGRFDTFIEQPTPLWGASLFVGYRLGLGAFPDYDGKQVTNSQGELRGGILLPVLRNGPIDRRRAGIRQAELGRQAADLSVLQARIEAVRMATLRYWDWAAAGRGYTLAQELLQVALTRDAQLRVRVAAGDLPAIDQTDNSRAIVQREGAVVGARRQLEKAAIELGIYLRGPDGTPERPPPERLPADLPEPERPVPGAERRELAEASDRRPEIGRIRAARRSGEVGLRWARNQVWPGLDLQLAASQDFGAGSATRSQTELEASVVLDVPIPNRTALGRVRALEAGLARTDTQLRFALDRVAADVADARSAITAALQRLGLARQELQIARELEDGELTRFRLGQSTLFFVNLREQARYEVALRVLDTLADCHRAIAAYQAATATQAPPR